MTDELRTAYVSITAIIAVLCVMILADLHQAGEWMWKKAPYPVNRMPGGVHRLVMFATIGGLAFFMGLDAFSAAFLRSNPSWVDLGTHLALATIAGMVVAVHPFQAALESPNNNG